MLYGILKCIPEWLHFLCLIREGRTITVAHTNCQVISILLIRATLERNRRWSY